MRLRVALRELRHSCALSAAEERALLKHCRTVESLATADFPRLAGTCALRADGLRLLAHELTAALAAELSRPGLAAHADAMRTDAILSTGLESLDALLGGGLATGEVTELIGAPATGKTQLCLLACAARAAAANGGAAFYLDSGGAFCAERVYKLLVARAPGLSRHDCKSRLEERVRVAVATRSTELLAKLDELDLQLASTADAGVRRPDDDAGWLRALRLLVVDSPFGIILGEHEGADGTQTAAVPQARLQRRLRELAARHRLAVLVTNAANPHHATGGALGHAWQHAAHTRLLLRDLSSTSHPPSMSPAEAGLLVSAQVVKCAPSVRPVRMARAVADGTSAVRVAFGHDGCIE